jgi:hypothetical protein
LLRIDFANRTLDISVGRIVRFVQEIPENASYFRNSPAEGAENGVASAEDHENTEKVKGREWWAL